MRPMPISCIGGPYDMRTESLRIMGKALIGGALLAALVLLLPFSAKPAYA